MKCIQLTTGLIFKTVFEIAYTSRGECYDASKDSNFGLNGSLFSSDGIRVDKDVISFRFNSNNIIATWQE